MKRLLYSRWQDGQRFPLTANLLNVMSKSVMICNGDTNASFTEEHTADEVSLHRDAADTQTHEPSSRTQTETASKNRHFPLCCQVWINYFMFIMTEIIVVVFLTVIIKESHLLLFSYISCWKNRSSMPASKCIKPITKLLTAELWSYEVKVREGQTTEARENLFQKNFHCGR